MKKAVILLCTIIMIIACFSGCENFLKQTNDPGTSTEAYKYNFPDLPASGTYDFEGKVMTVMSYHGQEFEQREDFYRRFDQDKQISERFNVQIAHSTNLIKHENDALAGRPSAQIAYLMNHQLAYWIRDGIVEPLNDYAAELKLDTNPRWDKKLNEWCNINGVQYAVGAKPEELWKYHYVNTLFMNKELLQSSGIDPNEIYTMQENKEWTWEKFKSIANQVAKDTNEDGIIDVYAIAVNDAFIESLMVSNGTNFIKGDGDSFTFEMDNKAVDVLNYIKDLINDGSARNTEINSGYNSDMNAADFRAGKLAFHVDAFQRTWIDGSLGLMDMLGSYGVVSFPMAPGQNDYYYTDASYAVTAMFKQSDKEEAKLIADFMYIYNTSLYENSDDEKESYWSEAQMRISDEGSKYFLERIYEQDNVVRTNNNMYVYAGLGQGLPFTFDEVFAGSLTPAQFNDTYGDILKTFVEGFYSS